MKALTSRFSTGIRLNSHFCTVYIYFEYFCVQVWLYFVVLESIVQYIFTKNVTFLLVVKEDLVMAILWFSVLGTAACSTFMKFHGRSTKANISKDTGTIFRHLFACSFKWYDPSSSECIQSNTVRWHKLLVFEVVQRLQ